MEQLHHHLDGLESRATVAALAAALSPLPSASEGERDDKGTHNRPERLIKPKGFF